MSDALDPEWIEEVLLGGELRFTRGQAIELAGVSAEFAQRLWRALGFPHLADDTVAFTDGDVAALRKVGRLQREGVLDEEVIMRMVRAFGQAMSRLAR